MANEITQDTILAKKIDNYGFCNSNFVAPGEITVTITLNEYRELLATSATTKTL